MKKQSEKKSFFETEAVETFFAYLDILKTLIHYIIALTAIWFVSETLFSWMLFAVFAGVMVALMSRCVFNWDGIIFVLCLQGLFVYFIAYTDIFSASITNTYYFLSCLSAVIFYKAIADIDGFHDEKFSPISKTIAKIFFLLSWKRYKWTATGGDEIR